MIHMIELAYNFDGEAKISTGKQQKQGGKCLNSNSSGEKIFLGGSPFNLGGAVLQRGRYWGVSDSIGLLT